MFNTFFLRKKVLGSIPRWCGAGMFSSCGFSVCWLQIATHGWVRLRKEIFHHVVFDILLCLTNTEFFFSFISD